MIVAPSSAERLRSQAVRSCDPAEARVVVEADPHALGCERRRRRERGERAQGEDEADGASHEITPWQAGVGDEAAGRFRHPSDWTVRSVLGPDRPAGPRFRRYGGIAYTPAMDSVSVWEALFMLVVLKIPLVYLGAVVWWAIRAEPLPEDGRRRGRRARPAHAVRLGRVAPSTRPALRAVAGPSARCTDPAAARARYAGARRERRPAARQADTIAGFLCAFSLALSGIAIVRDPGLLAPVAIVVALVAVRMTESHRTLAAVAVAVARLSFFFGMLVAISTDNPLF